MQIEKLKPSDLNTSWSIDAPGWVATPRTPCEIKAQGCRGHNRVVGGGKDDAIRNYINIAGTSVVVTIDGERKICCGSCAAKIKSAGSAAGHADDD